MSSAGGEWYVHPSWVELVLATDEVVAVAQRLSAAAFTDGIDAVARLGDEMLCAIGRVAFVMGQVHAEQGQPEP